LSLTATETEFISNVPPIAYKVTARYIAVNQSINESIDRSINQSINQLIKTHLYRAIRCRLLADSHEEQYKNEFTVIISSIA